MKNYIQDIEKVIDKICDENPLESRSQRVKETLTFLFGACMSEEEASDYRGIKGLDVCVLGKTINKALARILTGVMGLGDRND